MTPSSRLAGIPPPCADLTFVRNNRTGRVHIARHLPQPGEPGWAKPRPIPFAEALALMFSTPRQMLCGIRLLLTSEIRASYTSGNDFADQDLCVTCVYALGDQQVRAFAREDA